VQESILSTLIEFRQGLFDDLSSVGSVSVGEQGSVAGGAVSQLVVEKNKRIDELENDNTKLKYRIKHLLRTIDEFEKKQA
jgi:hypothetical protein